MLSEQSEAMERCSLSPVTRLTALGCLLPLLLVALVTRPSTCNRDDSGGRQDEGQVSLMGGTGAPATAATPPEQAATAQATPTPLWAVVWGPTQLLEDETTHHFLSSQETERHLQSGGGGGGGGGTQQASSTGTAEAWLYPEGAPGATQPQHVVEPILDARDLDGGTGAEESEPEEVDPQFYVTVTISSLLILTAVIITAKLCYDRSCSHHPPPLSRGVAPPLSLALPRSLASEDSRQTLHSSPYNDRERIPVVNL